MGSGHHRIRRERTESSEDLTEIGALARRAAQAMGLHFPADPRELAVAMGFRVVRAAHLPGGAKCLVSGRTLFYENSPNAEEIQRHVGLSVATLVLEACGYDASQAADLLMAIQA